MKAIYDRGYIVALALALLSILLMAGCSMASGVEVIRKTSPDGVVDAVLMKWDVGATASTPFAIYIVPSGKTVGKIEPVLRGDKFSDLNFVWKERKVLAIHFSSGRIFSYTNFWLSKNVQNFEYIVTIQLIQSATETKSL